MRDYSGGLSVAAVAFACVAIGSLPGCNDDNALTVFPTGGTVLYQSTPLANATVVFAANQTTQGTKLLAVGMTDEEGRFLVRTRVGSTGNYDGAVAGVHRVTISKFVPPNNMTEAAYQELLDAETKLLDTKGQLRPNETVPPKVQLLAPEYSSSEKTSLTAEVTPNGKNDFAFVVR